LLGLGWVLGHTFLFQITSAIENKYVHTYSWAK